MKNRFMPNSAVSAALVGIIMAVVFYIFYFVVIGIFVAGSGAYYY